MNSPILISLAASAARSTGQMKPTYLVLDTEFPNSAIRL